MQLAVTAQVDVVSMDLRLQGLPAPGAATGVTRTSTDGMEATRGLLRARPEAAVLVLTMVMDESAVAEAFAAGARGYLLKSADPADVADALHRVARGGVVLGAEVVPRLLRTKGPGEADWPTPFNGLTERERRLVKLVATGLSNARIARELDISDRTVGNQVSAPLVRLSVPDRIAVALLARERGLGS